MFRQSEPIPVVGVAPDAAPTTCIELSQSWVPILIGLAEFMLWSDFWAGTEEEINQAVSHAVQLIGMLAGQECEVVDYVCLYDVKSAGGGSAVVGWQQRDLNTKEGNWDLVALSNDIFTPVAGTYILRAGAPAFGVNRHRIRLIEVGEPAVAAIGHSAYAFPVAGERDQTYALLFALIVADGETGFYLEHYCQNAIATNGLGLAVGDGYAERYTWVELTKIL